MRARLHRAGSATSLVLVAASLGLLPAAAQAQGVWAVDRERVNVRADATTQSRRVAVLRRGEEVVELRRVGQWMEVRLPAGDLGWIHGQLLQERLVVDGEGLRLRDAPSTRGTSVTMLFRGQEVVRLAQRGSWTKVRLRDGREGWVSSRFVRAKTAADLAAQRPAAAPAPASPPASVSPGPAAPDTARGDTEAAGSSEAFAILKRNPYAEGLQEEASGQPARALLRFEEVLADDPAHVNALVHAARAHSQLGDLDAALDKLYRALVVSGGRRDIYLALGEVYRLRAEPDSAARYQALFRGEATPAAEGRAAQSQVTPGPEAPGPQAESTSAPASPASRPAPQRPADVAQPATAGEPAIGLLDTPWMPVGLAGIGLLALAGVAWWVVSTSSARHRKRPAAKGGRFQKLWEDEAQQAQAGRATEEEEAELDGQIDARWRELKESAAACQTAEAQEDGMTTILDQVDGLRRTLEYQDERERLFADIVRLQNMKIDAMAEEIKRLRRG